MLDNFSPEDFQPVKVTAKTGRYEDGEWIEETSGEPVIDSMIVLPVTAASIKMMAEGSYIAGDKRFYCEGAPKYKTKAIFETEDTVKYELRDIQDRSIEGNFTVYFCKRIIEGLSDDNTGSD